MNYMEQAKEIHCSVSGSADWDSQWLTDALSLIRTYCYKFGYDLDGVVKEKREYNKTRADHTYAARAQANGKKF